jgi:hypothetical protein
VSLTVVIRPATCHESDRNLMSELLLFIKSILYQPMIGMDFTKDEPGHLPQLFDCSLGAFRVHKPAISCL